MKARVLVAVVGLLVLAGVAVGVLLVSVRGAAPVPSMVLIPAGEFWMGDAFKEGESDELPVHAVWVDAFRMDQYEVTRALWDTVRRWGARNGYSDLVAGQGKGAAHPVHGVNWYDCVKWCNARSEMDGRMPCYYTDEGLTEVYRTGEMEPHVKWDAGGYRLPTEAEWEKAARGGVDGRRFPWSGEDTIQHALANYASTTADVYDTSPTRGHHPVFARRKTPFTSPVGSFAPNGYGLYDMAGNVWEWCHDMFSRTYYDTAPHPQVNPRGPGSGPDRVLRGGCWADSAYRCRVAARLGSSPGNRSIDHGGFR